VQLVVRRTATLVLLAVLVCCIHIKADIWPLVLTGDAIPGTANFRFAGFTQAVVNTSGTIAFGASFTDPSTNLTGSGIFEIVGGQLIPVMMEGQALPDVPGSFGALYSSPSINSSGDIVFLAYTSERPQRFVGMFEFSNGVLHRVLDFSTTVPEAPGESFFNFYDPQINDQGKILFGAQVVPNANGMVNPVAGGLFLMSSNGLNAVALTVIGGTVSADVSRSFSINNRGDIAYLDNGSIKVVSGNSGTTIVIPPQVPFALAAPVINDNGDVAYINETSVTGGRGGGPPVPSAVVRWRNGTLEKVVAVGDPVPGFDGAVFDAVFPGTRLNESAAMFMSQTYRTGINPFGLLGRYQQGSISIVASENQYVDGIGTLDFIEAPNFDSKQGPLVTFVANAAAGTELGIYATTAAPQFTLRFPHIADGGGGVAGGWHTTFVLANRSTTAANATISFYDDNGNPLSLAVGGTQQSQTSIVVPALGVAEVQTQGGGPLTTGWAQAQSDQNLTGIGIFGLLDGSGNSVTEVGVPASLPLSSMSLFAQNGATTSTGVALANPNNTAANVTLTLKDSNSTPLAQTSVTIPPMGHLARYAPELFAAIPPGEFQGKIEVLSTQPLAGLTLRQRGSIFTSLPVIP
jgi:hypothetical protein